jgi:hypothetical protein
MKARKPSDRHPLLFYRRTMDRIWKATLALGIVLLASWGFTLLGTTFFLGISSETLLLMGAIISLALCIFAILARPVAYVQAHTEHLRVVTPFLRLNISYRRMHSVHPVLVQQLFPPKESGWSQRNYLAPFYGKTAVVVETKGYPMNPRLLKLFLPSQMFSPKTTGFVFVVADWMKFSTELDSFFGAWLQGQSNRRKTPGY